MRLTECYIENFGCLSGKRVVFKEGINCFLADNGSGKTTLTMFIQAMLYGIGDTRRPSLDENDRKKYFPWQGGRFGGTLCLVHQGKNYRIERTFGAKAADDTCTVYDTDRGVEFTPPDEEFGLWALGIDREGFLRTVFLSEKNLKGKVENQTISRRLSELVGSDGDVEGFKAALSLLENRRKFYYKRGGAGRISDLKAQLSETERKISELTNLERRCDEIADTLAEKRQSRKSAEAQLRDLAAKLDALGEAKSRAAKQSRYLSMLDEVASQREKQRESTEFFGGEIPTRAEVDRAIDGQRLAEALRREADLSSGNDDFRELSEFFTRPTDFEELDRMGEGAKQLAICEEEYSLIESESDPYSQKMKELFPHRVPTREEIASAEEQPKGRPGHLPTLIIIFGITLTVLGTVLGAVANAALYSLIALGAVSVAAGALLSRRGRVNIPHPLTREFLPEMANAPTDEGLRLLSKRLSDYKEAEKARTERIAFLSYEIEKLKTELSAFTGGYPIDRTQNFRDAVAEVRNRYNRYYSLMLGEKKSESDRSEKLIRAESLLAETKKLISRCKTKSDTPLEEIRRELDAYEYREMLISRMTAECEAYSKENGLTDEVSDTAVPDTESLFAKKEELSSVIRSLDNRIAVLDREREEGLALCESMDALNCERADILEKIRECEANLYVVQTTEEILTEACENMTVRYIGKTKRLFEKYAALIGGEERSGEFSVDTSFAVAKTERGATRSEESFSRGTRDLYALAMRMALTDSLYEKDLPFLVFDDPFTSFDDRRLDAAKAMLRSLSSERQILYFTCSEARSL